MESRRELISALDEIEKQKSVLQFRDLEKNRWYQVIECSDLLDGTYGKYFILSLYDIMEDKNVKAFSIAKLVNLDDLTGTYIKYKGLKEKQNCREETFHDISIVRH